MRSRIIENLNKIDLISDLVVISDENTEKSDDKRRIIKGVFKFKSATLGFLEYAGADSSLVIFKLNFEFLINKKISELEILKIIDAFNATTPLIKTKYAGNEAKKTNVTFIQDIMIHGDIDTTDLLLSHLSILSFSPILFSKALNENNFPHRSVTEG
jgi:hypothetical protein